MLAETSLPDSLNTCYDHFEDCNISSGSRFTSLSGELHLEVDVTDLRRSLLDFNPHKPAGPDIFLGQVLNV